MNPARRALLRSGLGLTVAATALAAAPLAFADVDADPIADLIAKSGGVSLSGARRLAFANLHTGENLDVAARELRKLSGVETAAVFGSSLRIAGLDRTALEAAIASPAGAALVWQDAAPQLEDVFIHLLGQHERPNA